METFIRLLSSYVLDGHHIRSVFAGHNGHQHLFLLLGTQKPVVDKENALEQRARREDQLELCFVVSYILES